MPEGTNIATQITRIANDRNTIRNKMIDFGLAESTANLDALATAVSGIANNGAVSAHFPYWKFSFSNLENTDFLI